MSEKVLYISLLTLILVISGAVLFYFAYTVYPRPDVPTEEDQVVLVNKKIRELTESKLLPQLKKSEFSLGLSSAPISLAVFSDFACPDCHKSDKIIRRLLKAYPKKVRYIWQDFPLERLHPGSTLAHQAAYCAGQQAKFWVYHDALLQNQSQISLKTNFYHQLAKDIGLAEVPFKNCLLDPKTVATIKEKTAIGLELRVREVPLIYLNNRRLSGKVSYQRLVEAVEQVLAEQAE